MEENADVAGGVFVGDAGAVISHGAGSCGMSGGEKADRKRQGEKGAEVCEGKVRDAGVIFPGGDCAVGGTAGHAAGDEKAPTRAIFR